MVYMQWFTCLQVTIYIFFDVKTVLLHGQDGKMIMKNWGKLWDVSQTVRKDHCVPGCQTCYRNSYFCVFLYLFSLYSFLLFLKNAELFFKTDTCTSVQFWGHSSVRSGGKTIHLIIQESQLYLLYLKKTVKIFISAPSP